MIFESPCSEEESASLYPYGWNIPRQFGSQRHGGGRTGMRWPLLFYLEYSFEQFLGGTFSRGFDDWEMVSFESLDVTNPVRHAV